MSNALNVHLVIWPSKLPDRDRMHMKDAGVHVRTTIEQLGRLSGPELLAQLPRQPNVPTPYDLPMPYYICNRCSPVGAIIAHVRPKPDGSEECELGIASLRRAAEFLAHNLGASTRTTPG